MNLKLEKDLVVFDVETTDVDTTKARIVQIAVVKYKVDGTVEEKDYLINPTVPIPPETTEIHSITNEMVEDKPTFKQYAKNLKAYFQGCDIGGFNSNSYDINVLNEEFERAGVGIIDWNPALVDVMALYRQAYSGKLTDIYKRFFGEDLDGAHSAIVDVLATVRVLDKILDDMDTSFTAKELDIFLQGDSKRVDVAGKLYEDENGIIRYAFGKDRDKSVKEFPGFGKWMLKESFPAETKNILKNLIWKKENSIE